MKCLNCNKIIKGAGRKGIEDCPVCKGELTDMRQGFLDALFASSLVPMLLEKMIGVPQETVKKEMTLNQIKYFAGVFWRQNLSEEGLPAGSLEDFQGLLGMLGLGSPAVKEKTQQAPPV